MGFKILRPCRPERKVHFSKRRLGLDDAPHQIEFGVAEVLPAAVPGLSTGRAEDGVLRMTEPTLDEQRHVRRELLTVDDLEPVIENHFLQSGQIDALGFRAAHPLEAVLMRQLVEIPRDMTAVAVRSHSAARVLDMADMPGVNATDRTGIERR